MRRRRGQQQHAVVSDAPRQVASLHSTGLASVPRPMSFFILSISRQSSWHICPFRQCVCEGCLHAGLSLEQGRQHHL